MVALLATGCANVNPLAASETADPLAAFYDQEIAWEDCGRGFECGTITVPMDYDDPSGRQVTIAVKRLPASGDKIGSLVVNPGGPGGSGLDYVSAAPSLFSEQVRERFDIVGFDPRGVSQSTPIYCMDSAGLDEFIGFPAPILDSEDPADTRLDEFAQVNRDFVAACLERSGELIHHVGTANVARDLDVLREVLGDDKLTYLGKSYGTFIGAHYAELFGDKVRALVLDGAVAPHGDQLELSVEQAEGFTTALHAFVDDCLTWSDCPLADGRTPPWKKGWRGSLHSWSRPQPSRCATGLTTGRSTRPAWNWGCSPPCTASRCGRGSAPGSLKRSTTATARRFSNSATCCTAGTTAPRTRTPWPR